MLRLIGSIMIGAVFAAFGFALSDKLKKRMDFLDAFITSLTALETEITFGKYKLHTIFKSIDSEKLFGFYGVCNKYIREKGIREAWEKAAEETAKEAYLNENDINAVSVLGAELGKTDVGGQKKNIERARELLEVCAANAREEYGRLSKVYKGCGVLAGIFVVIVLI